MGELTPVQTLPDFFNRLSIRQPDIILMYIYLDGADGRELCLQVKNDEHYKSIPIILYSAGNIAPASVEKSLASGFLKKPFELIHLFDTLQLHLDKAASHPQ